MDRATPFLEGNFYHIYNRGVDKRNIFFRPNDHLRFQHLLYTRNSTKRIDSARAKGLPLHTIDRGETIVDIVAYALMPNHFHLLLHEKCESGISTFMRKLGTSFSMYMNKKYERTGPMMCKPFRSKYVDTDEYLRWLLYYIHLNPLELADGQNEQEFLDSYQFSSYPDYQRIERGENLILNKSCLPLPLDEVKDQAVHHMKKLPTPNVPGLP